MDTSDRDTWTDEQWAAFRERNCYRAQMVRGQPYGLPSRPDAAGNAEAVAEFAAPALQSTGRCMTFALLHGTDIPDEDCRALGARAAKRWHGLNEDSGEPDEPEVAAWSFDRAPLPAVDAEVARAAIVATVRGFVAEGVGCTCKAKVHHANDCPLRPLERVIAGQP